MMGERDGTVVRIAPADVHGVAYVDITVAYDDGSAEAARLGIESVPDGLRAGDRVVVSRAVNMIVAVRRRET